MTRGEGYRITGPAKRSLPVRHEPKPCPVCYAPMVHTSNGWRCARHGAPKEEAA